MDDIAVYAEFKTGKWHAFWHGGRTNTGPIEDQELCVYYITDRVDSEGNNQFVYELISYGDMTRFSTLDDILFTIGINAGANQQELYDLTQIIHEFVKDVKEEYKT